MKQTHYQQADAIGFIPKPKGELVVLCGKNEGIYLESRLLEGVRQSEPVASSSRDVAALQQKNAKLHQGHDNDDDEEEENGDEDSDEDGREEEEGDDEANAPTSIVWNGYRAKATSQGHKTLSCGILGRTTELPVNWPGPDKLPLVWIRDR